ncbi:hypothetical protein [Mechercharimyces sp. CAU 1602]|uniref:hypothetical protein n=1 Tax=Mechercharimyces sp. CAU 1602 TaxID=2973933 RepID=UPI0021629DC9|nr:hypothetical protein [Mechercharimyces sp. CAU 1602]MCS1351506.1 hypothetical protein [Mechercharimyces sp. CAU 1602]
MQIDFIVLFRVHKCLDAITEIAATLISCTVGQKTAAVFEKMTTSRYQAENLRIGKEK